MEETLLIKNLTDPESRQQAFSMLVQQYQQRLYWHIRRIVLQHDDADDVLQNTFIKIYSNLDRFRADSSLYTWMYRIATNEALNHLKAKARQARVSDEDYLQHKARLLEADVYFEGEDLQLRFQQALARLPEKQRLVFQMKYFEELTFEEISEILEVTSGGLKASYHHAVQKLKRFLTES